jgi:Putative restriction endonuclease
VRHAACVGRLNDLLSSGLGRQVLVWVQNPIVVGERQELQPDLAVLRRRDDYYATARPGPADTLLLIEVAETTLGFDRFVKVPLRRSRGARGLGCRSEA